MFVVVVVVARRCSFVMASCISFILSFSFTRRSTFFDQAVSDWNNGDPDVLTLTSSVAGYDPDCTPIDGVMKVCNNDYGDTGWYGINEISSIGKEIVSSVAKMNDYYFTDDPSDLADRRQYTMCHEMGVSF